jgi:hypothetical protein
MMPLVALAADKAYNPDQPRDADGRWGSGGSSTASFRGYGKTSHAATQRYGDEISKKQVDKLTWGQKGSLATYTETLHSEAINDGLRNGQVPERYARDVEQIDKAIDKSKVPDSIVVYKGVRNGPADGFPIGSEIRSKAYLSTSLNRDTAANFTTDLRGSTYARGKNILEVEVPQGSHGLFMSTLSQVGDENEVLLPHGSRMVVTGVHQDGDYLIHRVKLIHD